MFGPQVLSELLFSFILVKKSFRAGAVFSCYGLYSTEESFRFYLSNCQLVGKERRVTLFVAGCTCTSTRFIFEAESVVCTIEIFQDDQIKMKCYFSMKAYAGAGGGSVILALKHHTFDLIVISLPILDNLTLTSYFSDLKLLN